MARKNIQTVLLYVQQFRGVGHRVRIGRIATALEPFFSVVVLDGGPPHPKPEVSPEISWRFLTPLYRGRSGVVRPLDERIDLDTALNRRRRMVIDTVNEVFPSALIVEFFPFARSLLAQEIEAGINRMRELKPAALVFSSIRDIPFSTLEIGLDELYGPRHEQLQGQTTDALVRLRFDGIFSHTDEQVISARASIPWLDSLPVPLIETGFVGPPASRINREERDGVVLSMGGGVDGYPLATAVLNAWADYNKEPLSSGFQHLTIFGGTYLPDFDRKNLQERCERLGVRWRPYSSNAREQISKAALSISRAGYNTCAELLVNRTPAILSPTEGSDQRLRANLLSEKGLMLVAGDESASIYEAMQNARAFIPRNLGVKTDGATSLARYLCERLAGVRHDETLSTNPSLCRPR